MYDENPNNDKEDCSIKFWNVEEWRYITRKSVPDIIDETSYVVSSFGRVFSCITNRFLKLTPTGAGYFRVSLMLSGRITRYYLVHRILKIEFDMVDDYKNLSVNHLDDDRVNNFIWNLDWCPLEDNVKYARMIRKTDIFKQYICNYDNMDDNKRNLIIKLLSDKFYTYKDIANLAGCPLDDIIRIEKENNLYDI